MGSIFGSVLRGFPRSPVHGLAECAEPGGDYRGGAGSWLKTKVLTLKAFDRNVETEYERKVFKVGCLA